MSLNASQEIMGYFISTKWTCHTVLVGFAKLYCLQLDCICVQVSIKLHQLQSDDYLLMISSVLLFIM